jgi:predicted transcriptional regulator
MKELNNILHEVGISKVKLAKYLGVSRQMIYNYLEVEDINKWPKDKKILLLNLLDIKKPEEIFNIKIDTDYINELDKRLNSTNKTNTKTKEETNTIYEGLGKKQKELMKNIIDVVKENLENPNNTIGYNSMKYFYNFLQSMNSSPELRYILAYVAKETCFEDPNTFVFDEDEQFVFESIMFTAMTLYNNGGTSRTKLAEAHNRFIKKIERKKEEKLGRTMELTRMRLQAMQELGYTEVNEENVAQISEKMAEIETRKVGN